MAFLRKSISMSELAEHAETASAGNQFTAKSYDAQTGGWTRPVKPKPVPGSGNGTGGRLRRNKK